MLYGHNMSIEEKMTGKISIPIQFKCPCTQTVRYHYGVHSKCTGIDPNLVWITSDVKYFRYLHLSDADLKEPLVHVGMQEDAEKLLCLHDAYKIIEDAVNLTQIATYMKRQSDNSPIFDYRLIPFMSTVCNILLTPKPLPEHSQELEALHNQHLNDVLTAWKMDRLPIIGDGNCCFSAVACSLVANYKSICENSSTFFSSIGIGDDEHSSQAELAQKLRGITVQEWQNNCQEYKGFLTSSNVLQESQLFLSSSHFDSDLGDTVLLALSNALGISVIVFSSVCAHSVINIMPRQLRTNIPIHLAYLQYGPGHYDVALPSQVNNHPDPKESKVKVQCTCGRDDKTGGAHCKPISTKYTTVVKCKCLQAQQGCSSDCKCRNCVNSEGKRPILPPQRKRYKYD